MDNEIIDKVIKASFDCWAKDKGKEYLTVDDLGDDEKEFAREHAIAIIKAMREPTDKMKTLVTDNIVITNKCFYCGGHIDGWKAMIDCIIND
jgi:hypothetical protein